MSAKIYISGMHSGQNPCSGVGIARSIKNAFPHLRLVGVDHWQGSSGLHDAAIDETLLLPQWTQLDDERHADDVRALLDVGHLWISALDMEVHWLSENVGAHPNLLAPGERALELSAKPAVRALEGTDFRVPEFIKASLPDSEIHAFLRHNSWQCWLKSPYHDARRITGWSAFERAREGMSDTWKTTNLFIQRHVVGTEETIAFAAHQGKLVGAAFLEKRQLTGEGKTWAGRVTQPDGHTMEILREIVRRMNWSGGGELEYVRDPDGNRWIIECNPRFPAWIFGAALAGQNVVARLISSLWDLPLLESVPRFPFFTRVVQEIAACEEVGIPLPPDPTTVAWTTDGKKGKGGGIPMDAFRPSLRGATDEKEDDEEEPDEEEKALREKERRASLEKVPPTMLEEVSRIAQGFEGETPARVHLDDWTRARFRSLSRAVNLCHGRAPEIRIGFSVKTSPTDEHLRKAREYGFYAECISQMEVHRALRFGWRPDQVILNGPGKFWPITGEPVRGLHMLFCDSIEEFERVIEVPDMARCLGFRMRLPKVHSRFGNSLTEFESFQRIVASVRRIRGRDLGFHFHMPSWSIGVERWMEALDALLFWCRTLENLTEVPVRHLDLGGGFFPADLERLDFASIQEAVSAALPNARALYFEPGRALTQDDEVLVSRVLDVRRDPEGELKEIVVDGCIAELPLAHSFTHRIYFRPNGAATPAACTVLGKGNVRLLGRICMEDDILSSGVEIPDTTRIGDFVIFGDAGGYERSMSYVFGRG